MRVHGLRRRPQCSAVLIVAFASALLLANAGGDPTTPEELRSELHRLRVQITDLRSREATLEQLLLPSHRGPAASEGRPPAVVGLNELEGGKLEGPLQADSAQAAEEGELEPEGEDFSPVDVGCGWLLLGGVAMVMVLFYLVNWHDDNIRRFSWRIISTTVSIFTAVLVFNGFSGFVMEFLLEEVHGWPRHGWRLLLVDYFFVAFWFAVLQFMTFYQSGATHLENALAFEQLVWVIAEPLRADCDTEVPERDVRNVSGMKSIAYRDHHEVFVRKKAANREMFARRTNCWATLLAHMTGFAAINAGGQLQHVKFFERSAPLAMLAVVVNLLFLLVLFRVAALLRQAGRPSSGGPNGCRELFHEEVEEAENDVLSLSTSFLTVQALRFALTGALPGKDGIEEPELARGPACVLGLYGAGLASGLGVLALLLVLRRESRVLECVQNTCAMVFAWCLLWATRWLALGLPVLEELRAAPATILGRVLLALVLSTAALLIIFLLDLVEDNAAGARVARVVQNVVNALCILIGFSWEHCFDGGVEAVVGKFTNPVSMDLALTALVAMVIIPAWRRNILARVLYLEEEQKALIGTRHWSSSEEGSDEDEDEDDEDTGR